MSDSNPYGIVEFGNAHAQEVEGKAEVTVACSHQVMTWTPPKSDSEHLRVGFSIRFDCYTGNDGVRRFLPRLGDWGKLERKCYLAGMAVRTSLGKLPKESRTNERLQFLASQYLRSTSVYFKRHFRHPNDLHIRSKGRLEPAVDNVMLDLVDLHSAFAGIKDVRGMAQDARQDFQSQFFDGLYRMALSTANLIDEQNHFHSPKFALLADEVSNTPLSQEELEEVNERFFKLVEGKLELQLESDEFDFDKWLTSSRTSLPSLLARKKGHLDVDRQKVNLGLYELGWRGIQLSALNINAVCVTIKKAIADLTPNEERIFDSLYLAHEELCKFPLLLLLDRHEFLKPAVVDIWNGKSLEEVMPAIHQLLFFYGSFVRNRRPSDRQSKERGNKSEIRIASVDFNSTIIEKFDLRCSFCDGSNLQLKSIFSKEKQTLVVNRACTDCSKELPAKSYSSDELRACLRPEDLGGSVT